MALPLVNTFETGIADETAINGNSGNGSAGNAFDVVEASGGTVKFDTNHPSHGTLSARFDTGTSRADVGWFIGNVGSRTEIWGRSYIYKAAAPTNDFWHVRMEGSNGNTFAAAVALGTDLVVLDANFAGVGAGITITWNQWIRIEFHLLCSATVGIIEAKAFVGDSTSVLGTATITNTNTLTQVDTIYFGNAADTIDATTFWVDDIVVNATGYPGPAGGAPTAPTAPQTLTAAPGNNQVVLNWTVPTSNGGSAITGYKIYRSTTTNAETLLASPAGTGITYTDNTAVNGTAYFYKVTAVNAAGESALSNEVTVTPRTIPSAPQTLVATAGDSQVSLSWSAPASNGGSAVTAYKLYRSTTTGAETLFASPAGTGTSYVDGTAINGTTYFYKVSAVNLAGESALSSEASDTPSASLAAVLTRKRFYGPALLTNAAVTLYTCPIATTATIRHIHVTNPSGSPVNFTFSIGTSAAATRLWDAQAIDPNDFDDHLVEHSLLEGEIIQAFASVTGTLNLTVDGYELTGIPAPPAPIYPADTLFPHD